MMNKSIALVGFVLCGCDNYAETFDCKPGIGVGCQSLSTVNQMVEEDKLPIHQLHQVWIAGYEDEEGNYHEPRYIELEEQK